MICEDNGIDCTIFNDNYVQSINFISISWKDSFIL